MPKQYTLNTCGFVFESIGLLIIIVLQPIGPIGTVSTSFPDTPFDDPIRLFCSQVDNHKPHKKPGAPDAGCHRPMGRGKIMTGMSCSVFWSMIYVDHMLLNVMTYGMVVDTMSIIFLDVLPIHDLLISLTWIMNLTNEYY